MSAIPAALPRRLTRARVAIPRPELVGLMAIAAVLNLWALSRNGFANDYYAAAVRSMSTSWHAFLYGSFDSAGVMTVDKPPLASWVQALSVRAFGFNSLSLLVPQALMGMASVALVYDLVRRPFGRGAGFVAGLVLAVTPITVAISRHNNPDALLILCCVAALWFFARALEDGRTKWLVWAGVCVGLGFETKMGVALMVLPGMVVAWLWVAPRGRPAAVRQLLAGGLALLVVGGAWPLLMALTPSSDRPWISGTSDNSIWSLITGYNGVGRLAGQAGGPQAFGGGGGPGGGGGGGGGGPFGGPTGVLRLLDSSLGGQAGWLLGFAVAGGIAVAVVSRLRRTDPRTGWVLAVGGAFLTSAVAFSFAGGIFHPYYVSFLAPFTAALVGAGAAVIARGGVVARVAGPAAVVGGVATELAVLHHNPGQLTWLKPVLVLAGLAAVIALAMPLERRMRLAALAAVLGVLLLAPATWAVDTLSHATSGTFPAGGPASAAAGGFGGGRGGGPGGTRGGFGGGGMPGATQGGPPPMGAQGAQGTQGAQGAGPGGFSPPAQAGASGSLSGASTPGGGTPGTGSGTGGGFGPRAGAGAGAGAQGGGGMFGGNSSALNAATTYAKAHGGGTIGVSSQQGASQAIIRSGADVAGIGGFSGRESEVSIKWLAEAVRDGRIRWVLVDSSGSGGPGADGRVGSSKVMAAVQKVGKKATSGGLYDLSGKASALEALAS